MFETVKSIASQSFVLLAQMGPYMLLGIAAAGLMHVLLPVGAVARQLGGSGFVPTFKAAVLGIPLPICSCGVVPVAASLKKSGANNGAVVSFLVTTPTTGVDSILATYALLGGAIAIARVVSSFVIGLVAGIATGLGMRSEPVGIGQGALKQLTLGEPTGGSRLVKGANYAFGELFEGIARPLAIGTVLGGCVTFIMPPGLLEQYVGQGIGSYLIMLVVGIPLYVCASGSIPLAAALLIKGMSPGAVLVFLIAGPATNIATVTVVSDLLGKKVLAIYLSLLALGSLAAGIGTDAVFAAFPEWLPTIGTSALHGSHGLSLLEIICGAALGLLVFFHLGKQVAARLRQKTFPTDGALVFKVDDMNCQHCAGTITKAVESLPGIRGVDADLGNRLLSLEVGDGVDEEKVAQAIKNAGFHPVAQSSRGTI